jgi:hypothetical protein
MVICQGLRIPAFLPYANPQQNLRETRDMTEAYRYMLADPAVKAPFLAKVFGVIQLDLVVSPAIKYRKDPRHQEVAEFARWAIHDRPQEGWFGVCWDVLSGTLIDGYCVVEPVWGEVEDGGEWAGMRGIACTKGKDPLRDFVPIKDEHNNIIALQGLGYNAGKWFDPKDFIIIKHLGLFDNPLGMSDLRAAYGSYWLLDTCRKLRAIAGQKFAGPIVAAEVANPVDQPGVEAALADLRWRNWTVVPAGVKLQVIDMAGRTQDQLAKWEEHLEQLIARSILGSFLTMMTSSSGTGRDPRGDSGQHEKTASLSTFYLSEILKHLVNGYGGLIRRVVDMNYADVEAYPVGRIGGDNVEKKRALLQIDQGLAQMGFHQSVEDIEDRYDVRYEPDPEKRLQMPEEIMPAPPASKPFAGSGGRGGGAAAGSSSGGGVSGSGGVEAPKLATVAKGAGADKKKDEKINWVKYVGPRGGVWRRDPNTGRRYHDVAQ